MKSILGLLLFSMTLTFNLHAQENNRPKTKLEATTKLITHGDSDNGSLGFAEFIFGASGGAAAVVINENNSKLLPNKLTGKIVLVNFIIMLDGLRREHLSKDYTLDHFNKDLEFINDSKRAAAKEEVKSDKPKLSHKVTNY